MNTPYHIPRGIGTYESLLLLRANGGACWPLDDAVGAASIRELTGVYPGIPSGSGLTLGSAGPVVNGAPGAAIAFDGVNGYINCNTIAFSPGGAFTFACWAFLVDLAPSVSETIFACSTSSGNYCAMALGGGVIRTNYYATSSNGRSGAITLGWHHLAMSKAAGVSAFNLYIDGVAQSGTVAASVDATLRTVIGARTPYTNKWPGSIAYATIIPAALSAETIQTLYLSAYGGM